uniref:PiggyBac transposable element-derived protein domain-containing protein n=3 Tax=Arion vulgaris TaxID=1028688 RepID=A0A0B7BRJ8_9EUPU
MPKGKQLFYPAKYDEYVSCQFFQVYLSYGSGYYVICKVGQPFLGKYHPFYYVNYFASLQLAVDLLNEKTYSCSTIIPNRKGWPAECRATATKRMQKGSVMYRQQGNIVATVWRDKRFVNLLSTNTMPEETTVSCRAPGGRWELQVPSTMASYNKSMGGVDKFDRLGSCYTVGRKSIKWWRYLFNFLLQTSIINSWIIYSNSDRSHPKAKDIDHIDFRLALCTSLMKSNIVMRRANILIPTTVAVTGNQTAYHMIRIPGKCKTCFWCHSKKAPDGSRKCRRESVYGCNVCQMHLCKGECYSKYHSSLET